MTLMDAKEYDPRPKRRLMGLLGAAIVIAILAWVGWLLFRYQPEKNVVNRMFDAIEAKDFEKAFAVYVADPDWKQHQDKYSSYPYNQFALDWGPSGDFGPITVHKIVCAAEPPKQGFQAPSGVVVMVRINNRADPRDDVALWVEKKTKTVNASPVRLDCKGAG